MRNLETQIQTTKTLIKFCEDHDYPSVLLNDIRDCLKSLQKDDLARAISSFKKVPLGGMGCFNDWLPSARFPNETPVYVSDLFQVLIGHWNLMMQKLSERHESKLR
jgi:hypothetical protein